MKILNRIFIVCLVSGCSVLNPNIEPETVVVKQQRQEQESLSPLSLSIKKVEGNSKSTRVIAEVRAVTDWDVSRVSLKFSVFKDGQLQEEIIKPLQNYLAVDLNNKASADTALKAGEILPIEMELAVGDVSDYQLVLGWGEEAEIVLKPELDVQNVKLVDLGPDQNCDTYYCDHHFAIEAELFNSGQTIITETQVQLNLVEIELQGKVELGEKLVEEIVDLKPLEILPGAKQKIRLKINQPLPAAYLQQFMAQIKVIEVR
jgi:hypothetical protein